MPLPRYEHNSTLPDRDGLQLCAGDFGVRCRYLGRGHVIHGSLKLGV